MAIINLYYNALWESICRWSRKYITPEMEEKVNEQLDNWFPE